MPIISVIMSVYNEREEWLNASIQSILDQTIKDFELIIICDNPNAVNLLEIVKRFEERDKRIVVIINEKNLGLVCSLNKGLEIVTGKFIARMDADDISHINRFESQLKYLKDGNYDLVASRVEYIDESGKVLYNPPLYGVSVEACKKSLLYKSILVHPTWFFKREILDDLINYRVVNSAEDYDFLCRLFYYKYKAVNQDEILLKYRIRSNSITVAKAYQQHKIARVVRREYRKCIREGFDYNATLVENKVANVDFSRKHKLYDKGTAMYNLACKNIKNRKMIRFLIYLIAALLLSPSRIDDLMVAIMLKIKNR